MKRTLAVSSTKRWIEKIQARVFCPETEGIGGNPVTIFAPLDEEEDAPEENSRMSNNNSFSLSPEIQSTLAQTCSWESVMVNSVTTTTSGINTHKELSFFMPTGQEVSFCAHAAMAGAIRVATELDQSTPLQCRMLHNQNDDDGNNNNPPSYSATVHEDDIVTLHISQAPFSQQPVEESMILYRILREHLNLQLPDVALPAEHYDTPTFVHASVARPKTLVFLRDADILQKTCQAPTDPELFARALDSLGGDTTGLYLYTPHPDLDGAYLCRQFPKASGYAEDPATGIAAAALAAALERELPFMKFFQGDAMGKPSLILVEDLQKRKTKTVSPSGEERQQQSEPEQSSLSNESSSTEGDDSTENDTEQPEPRASTFHDDKIIPLSPDHQHATLSYKLLGKIEIDDTEEICLDDL